MGVSVENLEQNYLHLLNSSCRFFGQKGAICIHMLNSVVVVGLILTKTQEMLLKVHVAAQERSHVI